MDGDYVGTCLNMNRGLGTETKKKATPSCCIDEPTRSQIRNGRFDGFCTYTEFQDPKVLREYCLL